MAATGVRHRHRRIHVELRDAEGAVIANVSMTGPSSRSGRSSSVPYASSPSTTASTITKFCPREERRHLLDRRHLEDAAEQYAN